MKIAVLTASGYRQLLDKVADDTSVVVNRAYLPHDIKGVDVDGTQYFWGLGFKEGETRREFDAPEQVTPFLRAIRGYSEHWVIDFA